jgi:uncharacterized protein (TIGR03067 family)
MSAMIRQLFVGFVLLGAVGCGPSASGPGVGANVDAKVKANDMAALEGTWRYERQVVEGREIDVAGMGKSHIVISGDTLVRHVYSGQTVISQSAKLWIDPTLSPKQMDQDQSGPLGVSRRPSIYKIEGDRLTLCWNNSDSTRPLSFDSPEGSSFVLSVLKRQAK